MVVPTVFSEFNDVLDDLVAGATAVLRENFCGAYLQGSFAVGDADEYNDVDFIVATHGEIPTQQLVALQAMHKRLHALDVPWAKHLDRFLAVGEMGIAMSRWKQPYVVLSYCRMLHTLSSGRVASKKEGAEWPLGALDAEWSSLIQGAMDDRPDPWDRVHVRAEPEAVALTVAFVDYALAAAPI